MYNVTSFNPKELMNAINGSIDLIVVKRRNIGSKIKSIQYEKMFDVKERSKNTEEIISHKNLIYDEKTIYARR